MRLPVLLVLVAALVAGEADAVALLPADAAIEAALPDLVRSRMRWAASPWAGLAATAWGAVTVAEVRSRLSAALPGSVEALAGLRSAAAAVVPGDGGRRHALAAIGDGVALGRVATAIAGTPPGEGGVEIGGGRLVLGGDRLVWGGGAGPRPHDAIDPEADLTVRLDGARLGGLAPGLPAALLPAPAPDGARPVSIAVALDPAGLRERIAVPASRLGMAAAMAWTRWADPAELRALPATALCAATWNADARALSDVLGLLRGDPGIQGCEEALAAAGCPGLSETLRACDGPGTVFIAEGVPFPTLTGAVAMAEPMARRWIGAVAAKLNLAEAGDGARSGFLGLVPFTIGWVPGPGAAAGRLVATTDPAGLDAWRRRAPGFAEHEAVRAALTAPARCVLLGAGRGGVSWAAFAQLAVPLFAGMGNPHVVALPTDLRSAGGRGWIHGVLDRDGGLRIESGGLLGGPACLGGILGAAVPAVLWVQQQQARERRPPPPSGEPKVF